jgi:hypothetical protein
MDEASEQPDEAFHCPHCDAALVMDSATEPDQVIQCPHCGNDFSLAAPVEDAPPGENELDSLRIRQVVKLRRSAMRARTYALLILICCLVMGGQLVLTDVQEVRQYGWDFWGILYAVLAGAMAIGASIASGKAAALRREMMRPAEEDPEHAPQFEALSDGSQRVKNLEAMGEGKNEQRATNNEQ